MQHMRIARYGLTKGSFQEVADTAKSGLLPKYRQQPGFRHYGVADLGDREILSISVWDTRDQAEKATPTAASWVKENIADRVELKSNSVGDLAFFTGAEKATV
jgi:heme-degrading monooxygenase HmoA